MTPQEQNIPYDGAVHTKICSSRQCEYLGYPQPLDNFAKNSSTKDKFQDFCRKCMSRVKNGKKNNFPRIPDDQIKMCSGCKLPKSAIEFYRNKSRPDGVSAYCKSCNGKSFSTWVEENREHVREYARIYARNMAPYREPTDVEKRRAACRKWNRNRWVVKAIGSCRRKALKRGLPFGMKENDLFDKNTGKLPSNCPIFPHIHLDYNAGPDQRLWASVDKIVPELGYVSGNVWIVSMAANTWKSNGSNAAERERIVEIMIGKKPSTKPVDTGQGSLFDL